MTHKLDALHHPAPFRLTSHIIKTGDHAKITRTAKGLIEKIAEARTKYSGSEMSCGIFKDAPSRVRGNKLRLRSVFQG